jgi:hypothetical protein
VPVPDSIPSSIWHREGMARPRDDRQAGLLRQGWRIIDVAIRWSGRWGFLGQRLGEIYAPGGGQPQLPVRLVAVFSSSSTCVH